MRATAYYWHLALIAPVPDGIVAVSSICLLLRQLLRQLSGVGCAPRLGLGDTMHASVECLAGDWQAAMSGLATLAGGTGSTDAV